MGNFVFGTTMVLVVLLGVACSPATPQATLTPTFTPTASVTPTITPSPTATTTATSLPEYKAGITPEMEYEDCNQLHEDTLKTEMPLLVAKEHAWLDAQGVTADMITGHGMSQPLLRPTSPYIMTDFPPNSDYLTSCSILHMNNGTDMFLLGIAVKNNTSSNIAILHFAIDDQGLSNYYKFTANGTHYSSYEKFFNSESFFNLIKNTQYIKSIIPQIFMIGETHPELYKDWTNTVKYMEEYEKQGVSINDYIYVFRDKLDEKEVIRKLEIMVIPTKCIEPTFAFPQ